MRALFFICLIGLCADPCAKKEFAELEKKALNSDSKGAIPIYRTLHQCQPENVDILFYLGRALARQHQWAEAEKYLKKCLEIDPQYHDAIIQLINLYIWQGKLEEAENLCKRNPCDTVEDKECCARIAFFQGNLKKSNTIYREILEEEPDRRGSREALARNLMIENQYAGAWEEYVELESWNQAFTARAHVYPAVSFKGKYTKSQESDPSLRAPVVKTYYNVLSPRVSFPVNEHVRMDLKGVFFRQKEVNIYGPQVNNFNVSIDAGEADIHYNFMHNWQWNVVLKGLAAWGIGKDRFPFQNTSRFEPGTSVTYAKEQHFVAMDVHVESYIIKNFSLIKSQLLQLDMGQLVYLFRPEVSYHPRIKLWFNETCYQSSPYNWRDTEGFELGFSPHKELEMITLSYFFEHTHFQKLNQNYFSYKRQFYNVFGIYFNHTFSRGASIDLGYEGGFQDTYDLVEPIGAFVFTAAKQRLRENYYMARFSYRWRDHLAAHFGGEYFTNTLPYHDWTLNASLKWQF